MVHLVIHLTREVRLGGPVAFRWMYPIERDLLKLKSYVHNRAHPEGSIAEGYLAEESITFCSRYLSKVETVFTRAVRNDDEGHQNHIEESNNLCPGRAIGHKLHSGVSIRKRRRSSKSDIDEKSPTQAHRYVLFNVESVTPFREDHKRIIKGQNRSRRMTDYDVNKIHGQQFAGWFKNRVARMEEQAQVDKVFYVTDPKHKDWEVVRHVKVRDVFDMGNVDDQVGPYSNDCTFDVPNLHRIGDDGEDGIDITPDMECEVEVEENDDDYSG
ncbi:uncharacterized protein LOC110894773 [Helianthus annuus]|uniref:uncharacterized protein LOC110894773 n=1 Tax=Helianthus annuus TaxID=4232 RepID=UPI001652F6FA|nr:uncharacterized protein LOC110894773 [Helianthus annuus]XP_035837034.1 uncharacterized protein LOC110894773 [Helianthus annuus]